MTIRRKISFALVIVGLILLLSSLIAITEFLTMKRTVGRFVMEDVESINSSRLLLEITDDYNFRLLECIGDPSVEEFPADLFNISKDSRFSDYISGIKEKNMADSVRYAYIAYAHLIDDAARIWQSGYSERRKWFFGKVYPVYLQLRRYIGEIDDLSQQALKGNSSNLNDSFYRSLMPCIVAVVIGVILLLLFNYYINFYFFSPLEKISKGVRLFRQTRKSYSVKIKSEDEMQELSDNIGEIIRENQQLARNKSTE